MVCGWVRARPRVDADVESSDAGSFEWFVNMSLQLKLQQHGWSGLRPVMIKS